jgi:hypothetical protein
MCGTKSLPENPLPARGRVRPNSLIVEWLKKARIKPVSRGRASRLLCCNLKF